MSVRFVQSSSSTCLRLNGGKHQSIEAALVDDDGSGLVGTPLNQGSALVLVIHMYRNSILWFLISQRRCDVLTYEEGLEPVSQIGTVVLSSSSTPRLNAQGIADSDARKRRLLHYDYMMGTPPFIVARLMSCVGADASKRRNTQKSSASICCGAFIFRCGASAEPGGPR